MRILAAIQERQTIEPEWAGMPGAWQRFAGIALLAALLYAVFWLYRRERRGGVRPALRMALAGLRGAVILALAAVWLNPVLATYTIQRSSAVVAVLVDGSASMSVADGGLPLSGAGTPQTRMQRVQSLLSDPGQRWLARLSERNQVRVLRFGDQPQAVEWPEAPAPDSATATQPAVTLTDALRDAQDARTDLGAALRALSRSLGDAPLAALIVLSDGGVNSGMTIEETAALAERLGAPLHAVAVGEPSEPANARVAALATPPLVSRGDPLELHVTVEASGLPGETVELEVTAQESDGASRVVASRTVVLDAGQTLRAERVAIVPEAAGEMLLRARIAPLPGEAVLQDNQRASVVRVLDERLRVLLISGRPSYEYRFLQRLLERDSTIDAACWLQSADARAVRDTEVELRELPRQPEELFSYDAILLLDANPAEFDETWALTVRRFVDEFGGGLLVQAGSHFAGRLLRDPRLEEMVSILPVVPDPDADVRLSESGTYRTNASALQVPPEALRDPLLSVGDPETTRRLWAALPGVWWSYPVLREKPLASVLLRMAGPAGADESHAPVLLATQPFGAGRVMYLGFDGTWRWRSVAEAQFNRFWVQVVRHLAQARREGASKRGTIVLDRESVSQGEYVQVEARVLDERFEPSVQPEIHAELILPDESASELPLRAIPGRPGWFGGRFEALHAGAYRLRVALPHVSTTAPADAESALVKRFFVQSPDVEWRALRMQPENLTLLADSTGGEFRTIDQIEDLPDRIEDAARERITRGADHPLWDNSAVLSVLVVMLGVEWFIRRRVHLL